MLDIKQTSPDDYLAAFLEDPGNASLALYAGAALDKAGRHEEALIVWTFGDDTNGKPGRSLDLMTAMSTKPGTAATVIVPF